MIPAFAGIGSSLYLRGLDDFRLGVVYVWED